jgi:hypothetical protein
VILVNKHKVFRRKLVELEKNHHDLKNRSGLYFIHLNKRLLYVGLSEDYWKRFKHGYLKEGTKQHVNKKVLKLIDSNPTILEVIFAPMDKNLLKEQETLWIQEHIPEFNERENPRYEILSIQKVIGRIVNNSNREWSFKEMSDYLFRKWRGEVSYKRIDTALANKQFHLSNYCKTNQKQQVLKPKEERFELDDAI